MSSFARGQIVLAEVLDPQGRNPKTRPLVIVTETEEIREDQPFFGIAITGTFSLPLPDDCVKLPWDRQGHPRTGLKKPSVAVCGWPEELRHDSIRRVMGVVPAKELLEILQKIRALESPPPPAAEGAHDP